MALTNDSDPCYHLTGFIITMYNESDSPLLLVPVLGYTTVGGLTSSAHSLVSWILLLHLAFHLHYTLNFLKYNSDLLF